jgi:hypothetical protein
VFTIAVELIDLRGLRDIGARPRRIAAGAGHRRGRCGGRRRAGYPAGYGAVATAACAPQLSAAHRSADRGWGRAMAAGARCSGHVERPGPGGLSFGADLFYANAGCLCRTCADSSNERPRR